MSAATKVSAGQSGLSPVHASATSQRPAEGRHSVSAATKTSTPQLPAPSQLSATSQAPAAARHSTSTAAKVQLSWQPQTVAPLPAPSSQASVDSTRPLPQTSR